LGGLRLGIRWELRVHRKVEGEPTFRATTGRVWPLILNLVNATLSPEVPSWHLSFLPGRRFAGYAPTPSYLGYEILENTGLIAGFGTRWV